MILTRENVRKVSSNGFSGWNKDQLALLGVWPPSKGWLAGLVGTEIDDHKWGLVRQLSGVRKREDRKPILKKYETYSI